MTWPFTGSPRLVVLHYGCERLLESQLSSAETERLMVVVLPHTVFLWTSGSINEHLAYSRKINGRLARNISRDWTRHIRPVSFDRSTWSSVMGPLASSVDCKWSGDRWRCGGTNRRYSASGALDSTSPSPASPSGITAAWRWRTEPESQVPVRPSGPADKRQNVALQPPPPRAVYTATPEHCPDDAGLCF